MGINTRIGPIARTVEDAARVFSVISGYDPKDPLTAFAAGRKPEQPYETFTHETTLKGLRIAWSANTWTKRFSRKRTSSRSIE